MAQIASQFELPVSVERGLGRVRRRIRAYVWIEGLAAVAIALGAAFWIGMFIDWWLEPSPDVRLAAMVGVSIGTLYVAYRYLARRVFAPLSDQSLALLLERQFSELDDHLLTTIELAAADRSGTVYHPELVAKTRQAADTAMQGIQTGRLFDHGPLARAVVGALLLGGSIVALSALQSEVFGVWVDRMRLSPEPWPRRVQLEVVGFEPDAAGLRSQKIAHDDDFELLVHADVSDHVAPREIEIRYRLADGRRGRDAMIRVGEAVPGRDEFQLYRYEFKHVTADMSFDVVGGDDRVSDLQLTVVERPELLSMELECHYPDYLGRSPQWLAITGGMRIPEGTKLVLHAGSTKPLTELQIHSAQSDEEIVISYADEPPPELVRWDYGTLTEDDVLLISVTDVDDVASREPYRVSLSAVPDELPQVAVRLDGIGTAITPDAVIPLAGRITDDYGLDWIWFEYRVDEGPKYDLPYVEQPYGIEAQLPLDRFDTRAIDAQSGERLLRLEPKQKLHLAVKASDHFDLANEPRVGTSQQFTLDVVTPDQLLAQFERRELTLRQRFEAILDKMTDTRNLMGRIEFAPTESVAMLEDSESALPDTEANEANASDTAAARRTLARRRLRVAGSMQNVTQSAHEVIGVAEAFDDIYAELENNRIDNADLKQRLRGDIAEPLHAIGSLRLSELEEKLDIIEKHIEDVLLGTSSLETAIRLADEVLVEMQQVLERMLELETYNEVVGLLREIMADQEELNRKTKERQKERLKGLLED